MLRAFTGVRPLYEGDTHSAASREVSRDFKAIDHHTRPGPAGAFSVVGGKWTTLRLMPNGQVIWSPDGRGSFTGI